MNQPLSVPRSVLFLAHHEVRSYGGAVVDFCSTHQRTDSALIIGKEGSIASCFEWLFTITSIAVIVARTKLRGCPRNHFPVCSVD